MEGLLRRGTVARSAYAEGEVRTTYFKLATPTDTAYVEHRFAKLHENKEVRKRFYSFDAAGKRLVPAGWKPTR